MQKKNSGMLKNSRETLEEKAGKMSNKELRNALWEVRVQLQSEKNNRKEIKVLEAPENFPSDKQQLFLREEVYSYELKRRGLFEWALKTRKQKKD